jgi:hypothetical protein
MSPRRLLAGAGAVVALAATASPAAAHAIGGTYELPVPLWLYLAGAAIAVAASFVVTAVMQRAAPAARRSIRPANPRRRGRRRAAWRCGPSALPGGTARSPSASSSATSLPCRRSCCGSDLGRPADRRGPARQPVAVAQPVPDHLRRPRRPRATPGARALDAGLAYPRGLARWPAVALLAAAIWTELILPGGSVAATVSWLMLAYTLLTLAGMAASGRSPGCACRAVRGAPRLVRPRRPDRTPRAAPSCATDAPRPATPARCIDCPECAVAADDGERRAELRPWVVGLTEVRRAGWSDAAFIVLALAGVSYDGMRETAFGAWMLGVLLPPVQAVFGITGTTFLLVDTLAFALVVATFTGRLRPAVAVTRTARRDGANRPSLADGTGVYAHAPADRGRLPHGALPHAGDPGGDLAADRSSPIRS